MNSNKILITLAVVGLCCLTVVNSLKCFSCIDSKTCKKPSKVQCTYDSANSTRNYLDLYYTGVPNTTSIGFLCMSDLLKTTGSGEIMRKGCIFNNYQSCSYNVRPYFSQNYQRSCKQCNTDGCNPADRASGSLLAVAFTVMVTVFGKRVWP
ncbi:uncharacterized protein LOC128856281 [Anastrepha ludens]|uniref:uncharacterized protein LOC128856281 n=1 Tax=Anastrepha ludens TaxID=28586 RepID=UPI0023AEE8E7|nr:uncharacterized protein LOC128856281 [Anastrepha ludens]